MAKEPIEEGIVVLDPEALQISINHGEYSENEGSDEEESDDNILNTSSEKHKATLQLLNNNGQMSKLLNGQNPVEQLEGLNELIQSLGGRDNFLTNLTQNPDLQELVAAVLRQSGLSIDQLLRATGGKLAQL